MANGGKKGISAAVKELETFFNNWIEQPPLAVEAAVAAVDSAALGAVVRVVLESVFCSVFPLPPSQLKVVQGRRWINARNSAVFVGTGAGITCVMKKLRGNEDIQTRMIARFGAGVMWSMVRRDPPAHVIMCGVFVALMEAGIFKVEKSVAGWM